MVHRDSSDCHFHSSQSWILASLPQICRRHRSEFPTPCSAPVGRQRSGVQPGWSQGSLSGVRLRVHRSHPERTAPRDACTAGACDCFAGGSSARLFRDSCVRSIPDGPASPSNPHRSGPRAAQTPACLQRDAGAAREPRASLQPRPLKFQGREEGREPLFWSLNSPFIPLP